MSGLHAMFCLGENIRGNEAVKTGDLHYAHIHVYDELLKLLVCVCMYTYIECKGLHGA